MISISSITRVYYYCIEVNGCIVKYNVIFVFDLVAQQFTTKFYNTLLHPKLIINFYFQVSHLYDSPVFALKDVISY
jgi:hypothetical protein